ncbi:hypothetical protein D3C79_1097840 [compost metagenome]
MNSGKYSTVASSRPSIRIGLRPMRSDNQPKNTKNGAPITTLMISRVLAWAGSIFSIWVMKNST